MCPSAGSSLHLATHSQSCVLTRVVSCCVHEAETPPPITNITANPSERNHARAHAPALLYRVRVRSHHGRLPRLPHLPRPVRLSSPFPNNKCTLNLSSFNTPPAPSMCTAERIKRRSSTSRPSISCATSRRSPPAASRARHKSTTLRTCSVGPSEMPTRACDSTTSAGGATRRRCSDSGWVRRSAAGVRG